MANLLASARMELASAPEAGAAIYGEASSPLQCVCTQILVADGLVIVQVRGSIDDHSADEFVSELTAACELGADVVLVDLDRCVHLGAAGLRALAEAVTCSSRRRLVLRITAQPPALVSALNAHGIPPEIAVRGRTARALVPDSQHHASPGPPVSAPALQRV